MDYHDFLPIEEVERHHALIHTFSQEVKNTSPLDIQPVDYGHHKGVYRVTYTDGEFMAAAASREQGVSLLEEYTLLHTLFDAVPELFPQPIAHYRNRETDDDLLLMELFPHIRIDRFGLQGASSIPNFYRKLAYQIGHASTQVHAKTGRYAIEPHDGNILVREHPEQPGEVDIRFVDAIQFKEGTLEQTASQILIDKQMRPECWRFATEFRKGMAAALVELEGITKEQALSRLDFLRKLSPIL